MLCHSGSCAISCCCLLVQLFCLFVCLYWELNSRPHTYQTGAVPELYPQPCAISVYSCAIRKCIIQILIFPQPQISRGVVGLSVMRPSTASVMQRCNVDSILSQDWRLSHWEISPNRQETSLINLRFIITSIITVTNNHSLIYACLFIDFISHTWKIGVLSQYPYLGDWGKLFLPVHTGIVW